MSLDDPFERYREDLPVEAGILHPEESGEEK